MLTVIIIVVVVLIVVGFTALYREVGLGRGNDATESPSQWPLGDVAVGSDLPGISPDTSFTGFLGLCTDEVDSLGELYSAAVIAEDWAYPLVITVGKSGRPNGWTDRLDGLPGNIGRQEMALDRVLALKPIQLPLLVFLNEGRVLDASADLQSPTAIAAKFQRCRFGLARGAKR